MRALTCRARQIQYVRRAGPDRGHRPYLRILNPLTQNQPARNERLPGFPSSAHAACASVRLGSRDLPDPAFLDSVLAISLSNNIEHPT
jgi:hypothetical protein